MSGTVTTNPGLQGDLAMPMKFRCTACTARLHVPKRWAGTTIECPKCSTRVVVPVEATDRPAIRFEDRSFEKRIAAIEAATQAASQAVTQAAESPVLEPPPDASSASSRTGRFSRRMIAIPAWWWYGQWAAVILGGIVGFWVGFWWRGRP